MLYSILYNYTLDNYILYIINEYINEYIFIYAFKYIGICKVSGSIPNITSWSKRAAVAPAIVPTFQATEEKTKKEPLLSLRIFHKDCIYYFCFHLADKKLVI